MRRIFQEPLVHFAVLAAMVFLGYAVLAEIDHNSDNRIVVSQKAVQRIVSLYEAEAGVPPSGQELKSLVLGQVREMALAREARKLGLAEEDVLIERRLAQKMRFMIADVQEDIEPSSEDLEAWFNTNLSQFIVPATLSFQHVFFAHPKVRTLDTIFRQKYSMEEVLHQLRSNDDLEWRALGDPFMLNRVYSDVTSREISQVFGSDFARRLFMIEGGTGEWQRPILSTLGFHLVYVVKRTELVVPEFRDVRAEALNAWRAENRRIRTREKIESIIDKYQVVIEAEGMF